MPAATRVHVKSFMEFIEASPTSFHATHAIALRLSAAGFTELTESAAWDQIPLNGFVRRDGALIAWRQPDIWTPSTALRIVASHTDSPALKLKPRGMGTRMGFRLAETEIYGGPIVPTWFDRDLAVAGRIIDIQGDVHLVTTPGFARVSTLAVHLDRELGRDLRVDAQRDLNAIVCLDQSGSSVCEDELAALLAEQAGLAVGQIVAAELFLVPAEPPALIGLRGELLASYRLDNLASVFTTMSGLLESTTTQDVQVMAAFDHEEIGSGTPSGASGPFLAQLLRRLSLANGYGEDDHLAWLARGIALSADVAHGVHPNRPDRHDPLVQPVLGGGPVLKWSAPMRYATDAVSMAAWSRACAAADSDHQVFVNNGNIPGGTSLGPLLATRLGIHTVDAGVAVLSMHSARELCAVADIERFTRLSTGFLELG